MTKPLIYIAGPISHPDPVENCHHGILEGLRIRDTFDVAVIIPHATIAAHLVTPRPVDYWYQFDLDQLAHCDALYRLPGESKGADAEEAYAEELGLPVLTSGAQLRRWLARWRWLKAGTTRYVDSIAAALAQGDDGRG